MSTHSTHSEGYYPLADQHRRGSWGFDGEFQLIDRFMRDVSSAKVARRELLGDASIVSDEERWAIDLRKQDVSRRRTPGSRDAPRSR